MNFIDTKMHGATVKIVNGKFTELKASMKSFSRYVVLYCASTDI